MTVGLQSCSNPIATIMLQPCDNLGNGDEYTVACSHFAIEIYTVKYCPVFVNGIVNIIYTAFH